MTARTMEGSAGPITDAAQVPLTFGIDTWCELSGMCKRAAQAGAKAGTIPARKVAGKWLFAKAPAFAYLGIPTGAEPDAEPAGE